MLTHYMDLGWRSIRKTPVLSALMVMAISIGIGITLISLNVFQLMSHNPAGERSSVLHMTQLWSQGPDTWDEYNANLTYQDTMNLRQSDIPVRSVASFRTGGAIHAEGSDAEPEMRSIRVTDSDFFAMFSVPFLYGGSWDKSVDREAAHVVVINDDLNRTFFGGGNNVGKILYLDATPYQVVGIIDHWMPRPKYYDVTNGSMNFAESLFVPFSLTPQEEFPVWGNTSGWQFEPLITYNDRLLSEKTWIQFWAELPDANARMQFSQWLTSYVEQQQALGRFTDNTRTSWTRLLDVAEYLTDSEVVPEDNRIMIGLSALFLAVCLVNILGLLLTKFLKRAPEVGVRRAIGASRRQIFLQHMVEVSLIGLLGGVIGLVWAWFGLTTLAGHLGMEEALGRLDPSMWILTPSIALGAAMLAGMYPAWVICRTQPSVYLKSQ
ncbi:ABC transporter permease [Shewanella submarina]|uniref:ABC transporter permease n=1 Tax=Shewanella submarina TaxID=2016376 RepID=A0ABV7GFV6_9GAMM|nr:ABC transporter permease [Shewanella submarina]MCL1036060.1 ABC transporter permease [Shewanella submarina]